MSSIFIFSLTDPQHLTKAWIQSVLIETWFKHTQSSLTWIVSTWMSARPGPISREGKRLTCIPYHQEKGLGMCVIAILRVKWIRCISFIMSLSLSGSFDFDMNKMLKWKGWSEHFSAAHGLKRQRKKGWEATQTAASGESQTSGLGSLGSWSESCGDVKRSLVLWIQSKGQRVIFFFYSTKK